MTRSKQWCTQVWSPTCLCAQYGARRYGLPPACVHNPLLVCTVHSCSVLVTRCTPHTTRHAPQGRCRGASIVVSYSSTTLSLTRSSSLSIVCTPSRARVMQINFYPLHKQCTHSSSTRLQFATAEGRLGCQGESVNSRTLGRLASSNLYKQATATSVTS